MPPRPTVYPSGCDFATASAPSTPPAPARFSTTNVCPDISLIFWQRMRDSVSVAPPAGKPLTYFTGRVGQASCAKADRGANNGVTYGAAIAPPKRPSSLRRFTGLDDGITFLPAISLGSYFCLIEREPSPPFTSKKGRVAFLARLN